MIPVRSIRWLLAGLALWSLAGTGTLANPLSGFTADQYLKVIGQTRPDAEPPSGVTGITVPHHLLADDLMARGFWAASAGQYDRIILLAPDHFRALDGPFGTYQMPMETVLGTVAPDQAALSRLTRASDLFETLSTSEIEREHGIGAVTPFIRHFWPEARIVPVLASINSQPDDWRRAVEALAPLIDETTLVIQSTDFSHYLPVGQAVLRDQETLSQIGAGTLDGIAHLHQPGHLDSKAAQAIQMQVQDGIGSAPVVIANRNHVEYGGRHDQTTSYIVAVWHPDPLAGTRLRPDDQAVLYLAGDLLLGRYLTPVLHDEGSVEAIAGAVREIVGDAPLVVNFEGVLLEDHPVGAPHRAHVMQAALAGPVLAELGVSAASLANNHAADLGALGVEETVRLLRARDVTPLRHGRIADLGPLRVLPLTLFENNPGVSGQPGIEDLTALACDTDALPPLVAFVHWGREYTSDATAFERDLARALSDCGVTAVIGHHSHLASDRIEAVAGGTGHLIYSLGNFLFDQTGNRVSGALAEVRVFQQGTVATRLIPIPNLFDLGRHAVRDSADRAAR